MRSTADLTDALRELLGPDALDQAAAAGPLAASAESAARTAGPLAASGRSAAGAAGPVVAPSEPAETEALVRRAVEEGWRLMPVGAGVGLDLVGGGGGAAPPTSATPPLILVSSARMAGIVDYEPADLTLTAGAGTTLAALDTAVAEHGQWLPLDPPGGSAVTVGGAVAMGTPGPLAGAFGRARDLLLGLTLVDGRGRHLKLGGRVVKNVAGFDLVRLAAGSRGALGVFHRVSLRLYPRPRTDRTLVWTRSDLPEAVELGRHLARLPFALSVAGLEVHSGEGTPASEPPGPRVLLRVAHSPEVADRIEAEAARIGGEPALRVDGDASRQAARLRSVEEGAGSPFLLVQLLPDRLPALAARRVLPTAPGVRVAMRMDRGRVRLWGPGLEEDFGAPVRALSEAAGELGGSFRVLRTPRNRRDQGDRAGRSGPEGAAGPAGAEAQASAGGASAGAQETPTNPVIARLHRELRHAFDPSGILPGAWREGWR